MKTYNYESEEKYKETQVRRHRETLYRTVNRHDVRLSDIERIQNFEPTINSVLCLGCRQLSEVLDFKSAGFQVMGVDLLNNQHPLIETMDMHQIDKKWGYQSWDLIYMSHSLEHSNDPHKLFKAIETVTKQCLFIILPIQAEPDEKDPTVFDFMHPNANAFEDEIKSELSQFLQRDFDVHHVVYRHTLGADEMSFFVRFNQ